MELDFLYYSDAQMIVALGFLFIASSVIFLVSGENPHPVVVASAGLFLVVLSASAVWYIESMSAQGISFIEKNLLSKSVYDGFERHSNLFLFIFPFVTAAIGTNLMTEVITRKFKFEKNAGVMDVLQGLLRLIGGIIFNVCLAIYVVIKFLGLVLLTPYRLFRKYKTSGNETSTS